jgi:hypothetical protein
MASTWSDRDHAVVPWITLGGSSGGGSAASAAVAIGSRHTTTDGPNDGRSVTLKNSTIPHSNERHPHQQQKRLHHPNYTGQYQSCKILSLLSTRERIGIRSSALTAPAAGGGGLVSRVGWLYEGRNVTTASLAQSGAW